MAIRKKQPTTGWNPPSQFDEYRILWQLGRGGMGEVYLGHDTLLDRPVAIKFISAIDPDTVMREQFLTEARAAARLQHPNVVAVYRVGEFEGRPFIVSEFVRGQNLDHIKLPMPWTRALELSIGMARGLAAAHRRGVLHRDIKPGNVILPADGEIKLLDFGLAKFVEAGQLQELLSEGPSSVSRLEMTAPTLDIKAAIISAADKLANRPDPAVPKSRPGLPADTEPGPIGPPSVPPSSSQVSVEYGSLRAADSASLQAPAFDITNDGRRPPIAGYGSVPLGMDQTNSQELDGNSGIKGTPLYMAPEVLNGEPASRRSDIYSMGALLYELCVGSPPHYDPLATLEDLRTAVTTKDVPQLTSLVPNIDGRFAAVVERCLRRKPSERFSSGEELRDALEQLADTAKKDELPAGNPYRGLLPFEAEHRSLFFGRKSEIGTLVDRLRTESFVLVAADSGIGKSSICRAGVLPLIAEGALGANRSWRQVALVPGRKPLASLVSALCWILSSDEDKLMEEIRREPSQLPRILNRQIGEGRGLVLFIDQMEELVTISDPEEAAIVAEAFASLTSRAGNIRLLGTVRSDFLARLATLPELGDEISRALYILRPLSAEKIREVITGPAHKKGVAFESEAMVKALVESTAHADGGLPLLQFALAELWEVKTGDVITAETLSSIGGVEGALARHADHVLGRLPIDQRQSARRILLKLVTIEGTRARRLEEELIREGAPAKGALEALVRGRLLVARDTPEGAAYEVAHEALIKGWDTLRKWLEETVERRAVKQRLEVAVADWHRLSRSKDVLWSGRQLQEVRLLEADDVGVKESEFLAASRSRAERSDRVRRIALGSVPVLLLLLYGSVRLLAARDLEKQIATQVTRARGLLDQAKQKNSELEVRRRQAFALFDDKKHDPAEEAWAQALTLGHEEDRLYSRASQALEAALSLDGHRLANRLMLADVLYAQALGAERDYELLRVDDLIERMALYDQDGSRRQRWQQPGSLRVDSQPAGATLSLGQYLDDGHGKLVLQSERVLGTTPVAPLELGRGSYLLKLRASGRPEVRLALLLGRGEKLELSVPLPESAEVPPGMVYVPPGRFLFGAAGQETLRQKFYTTVPAHNVTLDGYLIGQYETTYEQYIEYLKDLPEKERELRIPKIGAGNFSSGVELKQVEGGRWQLVLQAAGVTMKALDGEMLTTPGRAKRATRNWLRFPVTGISRVDSVDYAAWLDRTGRLPHARICTEQEWERAGRGADDREYPMGNTIEPDDANYDMTYGGTVRKVELMGPDEVGSHPVSRSPYGLDDMTGNVFEVLASSLSPDETAGRSGGFSFESLTARIVNRVSLDASFRQADLGFRICASWSPRPSTPAAPNR